MTFNPSYILDQPATEDALGRTHFAETLARSLVLPKSSEGLVIGLEGGWGSGKSTLIGFITKRLREITVGSIPIVVEFNPWMVSNTGALVEALIGQIAASIGGDISSGDEGIRTGQKLLNYVGLLKHLKYLKYLPGASWAGNLVEDISQIAETTATAAEQSSEIGQKALDDIKKLLPSLDLTKKKKNVVEALKELDRPIVVVIDDLDRLPSDEIRAMIRAIKAVADFPRVTYLLAYERSIIARALGEDEGSGLSYLEKIVQVAYPIPPLFQRQLKKFAENKLQGLLDALSIMLRDYEQAHYDEAIIFLSQLSRHPRDVVRIINRLILSLPATHGEVNAADVIVFEALSQRFPALREAIHCYPADFTGHFFRGDFIDENDAFSWGFLAATNEDDAGPSWLKHLPAYERDRRIAEKVCHFLFPKQKENGDRIIPEDQLRIADPDRLARLFSMTSIEEVPEAKEIHALLNDPKQLENALSTEENKELLFLLEWIINYLPSCRDPAPDVNGCIEKLSDASQGLMSQGRLVSDIVSPFAKVMKRLLMLRTPECNACFLSIAKTSPLSISEVVILQAAMDQGKWKIRPSSLVSEDQQFIPDSNLVDEATRIWSGRVRESIANSTLQEEANLHSVLHRFAQFNEAYEEVYEAISKICETDEGLNIFLSRFDEGREFNYASQFSLVEDAEKLAQRINNSVHKNKYHWLTRYLNIEENIKFINEHVSQLKKPSNS